MPREVSARGVNGVIGDLILDGATERGGPAVATLALVGARGQDPIKRIPLPPQDLAPALAGFARQCRPGQEGADGALDAGRGGRARRDGRDREFDPGRCAEKGWTAYRPA